MDKKTPLHERRPRAVGPIGGLLFSPIFVVVLYLLLPLRGNGISPLFIFLVGALVFAVAGAIFPRFGKLAFQFAGNVLANLN